MNTKLFLGCFVAVMVAILAASTVLAGNLDVSIGSVSVNDENISGVVLANSVGEEIEVKVKFTANEDLEDLKVKAWISGYKDEISASTERFDAIEDRTYIKKLALELPNVKDIEDLDEDLTLHVEISDKNDDVEQSFDLTVQRSSYSYDLLSVEAPSKASAGDIIAIDIVLKNIGREDLDDSFVVARIPELGVYKKVYLGDLTPQDDDDEEDAREKRLYLVIPSDAKSGDYEIEIVASNYDTSVDTVKSITITGAAAEDEGAIDATSTAEKGAISNSVILLTVVLVIVFVVLLIVLIVLLTKKPEEKTEEFGETSYY